METKVCTKCGEVKALTAFGENRNKKDKKNIYCKQCVNERAQMLYKNNPKSVKERNKRRYSKERVERIEAAKKWLKENREKARDSTVRYGFIARSGLPRELIPRELTEAHVLHVKIKRMIKEKANG